LFKGFRSPAPQLSSAQQSGPICRHRYAIIGGTNSFLDTIKDEVKRPSFNFAGDSLFVII
jgi:hypothetical protein